MMDRGQLREALADWDNAPTTEGRTDDPIVAAARLVADPDTLVISKVDGEPTVEHLRIAAQAIADDRAEGEADVNHTSDALIAITAFLDALLEGQP